MAKDDEGWKRRRDREEEETDVTGSGLISGATEEKLNELFDRVEPLIEQVNSLYAQYAAGVETRPPLERRKYLDQVMVTITMMGKPTAAHRFRFSSINSNYLIHRDRWERMLKDIESGKIRRVVKR